MKNNNKYINLQPIDINRKPTNCEIIRTILWYIAEFICCASIFAIMYILVLFAGAL